MNKIVTVPDLVSLLNTKSNKYGDSGNARMLMMKINGETIGYIRSVKLDGWGDGLVTDVCLEVQTE